MTCFDIHTHRVPSHPAQAIVSHMAGITQPDRNVTYASVGIHPWYLTEHKVQSQLHSLHQALQDNRVVALGEAGLDRLRGCSLDIQISVFCHEVILAEKYHLPMIIHCVKTFNELIQLKKELHPHQPWIIHGYRGKKSVAEELLRHGCYLSFGAKFQPEALRATPSDRLFIETDESEESIEAICQHIAQARGVTPEELVNRVYKNVQKVFFKP